MGEELEALATRLREAAHYCTDLAELERHCKEVAQGMVALAAQQDGVREIGNCGGIKIIADKDVPDDVLELQHADGRVDRYKLVSGLEQGGKP